MYENEGNASERARIAAVNTAQANQKIDMTGGCAVERMSAERMIQCRIEEMNYEIRGLHALLAGVAARVAARSRGRADPDSAAAVRDGKRKRHAD